MRKLLLMIVAIALGALSLTTPRPVPTRPSAGGTAARLDRSLTATARMHGIELRLVMPTVIARGEPVRISLVLKNESSTAIHYLEGPPLFAVELKRRVNGRMEDVRMTESGKRELSPLPDAKFHGLRAGESLTKDYDLRAWYDLSPGTYFLTVRRDFNENEIDGWGSLYFRDLWFVIGNPPPPPMMTEE